MILIYTTFGSEAAPAGVGADQGAGVGVGQDPYTGPGRGGRQSVLGVYAFAGSRGAFGQVPLGWPGAGKPVMQCSVLGNGRRMAL